MDIKTLEDICEAFLQNHPALNDPDGALDGGCHHMSQLLCKEFPDTIARPLHVCGHRHVLPYRHPYWHEHSNPDAGFYHVVCCVADRFMIDITYRQLDSHSDRAYRIQTREEFMQSWWFADYDVNVVEAYMMT